MSSSFNPTPTPRRAGAASGSHSSITPAASRFRSSLVPMQRASPLRSSRGPSRVTTASNSSGPPIVKDLFRTNTTPKPSRTTAFAPSLPAEVTRTPASVRKLAPKGAGAGMAGTTSQELFKQRIPSPDPELSGAAISQALPENLNNRRGTVYADQYLAHKCPPEFDDDQRRQFFCILDLRRLKYAANEIFAKKDWKLNVINFAKEYEKSRGLIMLRYGLYEFKNVKPSEEVMRRWRKAHGLPEPDPVPEKSAASSAATGVAKTLFGTSTSKRKVDDATQSSDIALQNSTVNQNKRRNLEEEATEDPVRFAPSPVKNKRKADETDEGDENARNKLQKTTPSAARSRLEGIINNVQSNSSTPVGSPLKRPLFGASVSATTGAPVAPLFGVAKTNDAPNSAFAAKSNPYGPPSNGIVDASKTLNSTHFQPGQPLNGSKDSVLTSHKFGTGLAPKATNIFGYLSESSANNSGAENGDDTDSESGESQPETGSQDAAPSDEPSAVASTGTATPPITAGVGGSSLFSVNKSTPATSNPFGSMFNKPAESSADKSAENSKGGLFGRVSFGSNGEPLRETSLDVLPRAPSPIKELAPATKETPAKAPGDFTFNPSTTPITFGSTSGASLFAKANSSTDESILESKQDAKAPTDASSIFGKPVSKPATTEVLPKPLFDTNPSKQSSQPLFGAKQPEQTTSSLFGAKSLEPQNETKPASKPLFGNPAELEPTPPAAASTNGSLFGTKLPGSTDNEQTQSSSQSLFGAPKQSVESDQAQPLSQPLFGAPPKPADSEQTGTTTTGAASIFGLQKPAASGFSFGDAPTPKPLFGDASQSTDAKKPDVQQPMNIFGSQPMFGAPATATGNPKAQAESTPPSSNSQPLFGKPNAEASVSAPSGTPLFGGLHPASEPSQSNFSFGSTPASSAPSFFGNNNNGPVASSNPFGAPANPFAAGGASSTKRSAEEDSQPSKKVMFGNSEPSNGMANQATPAPFSFGGSQATAPSSAQPEKKTMFGHVAGESAGPGSPVPGRKILTPKRMRGAAGAARQASPSPAPSFEGSGLFGSQTTKPEAVSAGNTFGNSSASFSFGQQNDAPATGKATSSFSFGQPNTQPDGNAAGSASFTFGAGPSTPGGGSFTFGAGGGSSNPFAAAGGPSSQSFGAASGTPTPAGSFNFQFGGQGSSTPAPAEQTTSLFGSQTNGVTPAPTFSFTSATPQPTPQQNSTNMFAPQASAPSIFSGLQTAGAPGANSPFPAASSMNTTPVGGTPEPQAQQADGDAEPPQEQISLTQGGPGEEDEEVVYEVRAKALNYVPVKPGEDSPPSKSPWITKGLGNLRLLKHKATGQVRMLLRAEPRGHVAMNKVLLAGIDYKADGKTVKVMASKDDGSGLETWVLQVKTPQNAGELASALESWKASNK